MCILPFGGWYLGLQMTSNLNSVTLVIFVPMLFWPVNTFLRWLTWLWSIDSLKAGPGFIEIAIDYDLVLRHILTTKIFVNQAEICNHIVHFTIVNAVTIPLNLCPGAELSTFHTISVLWFGKCNVVVQPLAQLIASGKRWQLNSAPSIPLRIHVDWIWAGMEKK